MGRRGRTAGTPRSSDHGAGGPYVPTLEQDGGDHLGQAELLDSSPFEDDLDDELAARPSRSIKPSATVYLAAGVLLVGGFVGGVQADKHWGSGSSSNSSSSAAAAFAQARRSGLGGAGAGTRTGGAGGAGATGGFGGGAAAGLTLGTVKLVDGNTVYVQTSGGIVAVRTTGSTKISISKAGTVKDLPPGATVVVQGPTGGDGSVSATTITQGGGLGAGRAAGGGFPAGGGGG